MINRVNRTLLDDVEKVYFSIRCTSAYKCECCKNTEWLGQPIKLELHHIDGNPSNNTKENIQLLCPNCHAYTDNYCGKNTHTVSKEDVLQAAQKSTRIAEICALVGWNADSAHYNRVKQILSE